MPGPGINIPLDLSSLTNAKEKSKQLRQEVRAANKEIDALVKKGQAVPAELKKKYQEAQRNLDQFTAKVKSSQTRLRDFIDSRTKPSSFVEKFERAENRIAAWKGALEKGKKIVAAGEKQGYAGVAGESLDVAGDYLLASKNPYAMAAGVVAKGVGKGIKFKADMDEAQKIEKEGLEQEQKDLYAAGLGLKSDSVRRQAREEVLKGEGFFKNLKWSGSGVGSDRMYDTLTNKTGAIDPELEKKIDAKVSEAITKMQAAKQEGYKALDLGDFASAQAKFKEANAALKGSMPMWSNPAELYTQRESARAASKAWAFNNMHRAVDRTGD